MYRDSDSITQTQAKIDSIKARIERLRAERDSYPREAIEWIWADNALAEARYELRQARAVLRMVGRQWICLECGIIRGPEWVAYHGLWCDIECEGRLEEVEA